MRGSFGSGSLPPSPCKGKADCEAAGRPSPVGGASRPILPAAPCLSFAPFTVTNDGQNPLTQEKSLLQLDWSMMRLRPHSVSKGCTDTQFDFTPQSPHPSQTSSLMITR